MTKGIMHNVGGKRIIFDSKDCVKIDLSRIKIKGIDLPVSFVVFLKITLKKYDKIFFYDKSNSNLKERLFKKWAIESILNDYPKVDYSYSVYFKDFEGKAKRAFILGNIQEVGSFLYNLAYWKIFQYAFFIDKKNKYI